MSKLFPYGSLRSLLICILLIIASCTIDSVEHEEIVPVTEYLYEIHFVDVGQGDAILITTPSQTLLIDGGVRNSGIVPYLNRQNINHIDMVIGTHPHADHIGGLIGVFQNFSVTEVIDPGVVHTTITFTDYLTAIEQKGIDFTVGRRGMTRDLGDNVTMTLLHPANPSNSHLNNASVVAHITLDEVSVLLTGDLESEGEGEILGYFSDISSTILKVGHHGSRTSSTVEFLRAVQPEISIIMCGRANQYGHPHQQTLSRLDAIGTKVFRTDIHGTIVIKSDGKGYTVYPERE